MKFVIRLMRSTAASFLYRKDFFKRGKNNQTRMVQLPSTAAIEYVAACCRTRTRTRTRTKIGTRTKIVRGAYARSPQVQCLYVPSKLSVPSIVA